MSQTHHRIVIIGGGTAGITVAARLARRGQRDIAIIEPSERHYYQPAFTLVGGGLAELDETIRDETDFIPKGTTWIREFAQGIDPVARTVELRSGDVVGYDFLVVAPGIQLDWDAVPGMREALETDAVSSNYRPDLAPKTWRLIENFQGKTALFTQPRGAIKCGGAPQKIAYLAADHFQRHDIDANVVFATPLKQIFGVAEFRPVLEGVVERYGIDTRFEHELVRVHPDKQLAELARADGSITTIAYDLLHVVPPQSAPDFVKSSPIADEQGWAKVDKHTLQSPDHPTVFALGDASSLPTGRTGAAVRKQAPVLVDNLLAVMNGRQPSASYDGYSSCPLITAHNRVVLAEFDYDGNPTPSVPVNTQKERYDMYLLKRYGLPFMYWNLMLRGRA